MDETYSLVLNSSSLTNVNSSNGINSLQYSINWDALLPRKYKNFNFTWQLKSNTIQTCCFAGVITTGGTLTVTNLSGQPIQSGMQFYYNYVLLTVTGITTVYTPTVPGVYTINNTTLNYVTPVLLYSINYAYTQNLACSINFGSRCPTNDQTNTYNSSIGTIYPLSIPLSQTIYTYTYTTTSLDNGNIQIAYPQNNTITVNIRQTDLISYPSVSLGNYVLQLYFIPVLVNDKEVINSNNLLSGSY